METPELAVINDTKREEKFCYMLLLTCANCQDAHIRWVPKGQNWTSMGVREKIKCPYCECTSNDPKCFKVQGTSAARIALKQYKLDEHFEKLREERDELRKKNSELEKVPEQLMRKLEDMEKYKKRCEELVVQIQKMEVARCTKPERSTEHVSENPSSK